MNTLLFYMFGAGVTLGLFVSLLSQDELDKHSNGVLIAAILWPIALPAAGVVIIAKIFE